MFLHEFLKENNDELIALCEAKVAKRPAPHPAGGSLKHGIPRFLQQLGEALREEQSSSDSAEVNKVSGPSEDGKSPVRSEIAKTAARHGDELMELGFTVDQVVHDYGDLCQAVTELAIERHAPISNEDFHTLNLCLDNAIAGAVTAYGLQRDQVAVDAGTMVPDEQLIVVRGLRNHLKAAIFAVGAMKSGKVAMNGATGAALDRSLVAMGDGLDRLFADGAVTAKA
jgi:hypothetical protein